MTRNSELINKEIDRLHKRGKGDYQTLLKQVNKSQKIVELNVPQMAASLATQKTVILEFGRGTGKTTIRGDRWGRIAEDMPRSTGLFIGRSYQEILTRILPSLVKGLEMFGFYQNLHYFIGKQPPRSWRNSWGTAYEPPSKFDRYITFWNGMGIHLISQEIKGNGRGLNSDWIDGDEAALLNGETLTEVTDPTLRGTKVAAFRNSRYFGSKFYTSTTPLTPEGKWFIDMQEKSRLSPKDIAFISATCKWNLHNLMEGYMEQAKLNALYEWLYLAEYENVRPNFTKDSFYTLLNPHRHFYQVDASEHYYTLNQKVDCTGDSDLSPHLPLIVGVDWGAAINCLVVCQHSAMANEFRALKDFFVLGSEQKTQDNLFADFIDYYSSFPNKEILLFYDNTGNNQTGITKLTRAELAQQQLQKAGWKVRLMTRGGTNERHAKKHLLWERILTEDSFLLPRFRLNKTNCPTLSISMLHAKAKINLRDGSIAKDKSSERSTKVKRQFATDLSDAIDSPISAMFDHLIDNQGGILPSTI